MLDPSLLEQLKPHFANLESSYTLSLSPSEHEKQQELRDMLSSLATTSDKLRFEESGEPAAGLRFEILREGQSVGVTFRGVPGGHEFTSLVLALLNADGKGKLPDGATLQRVRRLNGPIDLTTYVSLSCTNCPDVVQALNLIAITHEEITHTMVDGEVATEEVEKLGVQAVPAVFSAEDLVHVGKGSFADLLQVLEDKFGAEEVAAAAGEVKRYDVLVVGGGPAGAAAAVYAARKGLSTAVVAERVGGQVKDTLGIENLIGTAYTEGPKLTADLEKHLHQYPIDILEHRRVQALSIGESKSLKLKGGEVLEAPTVIVASGARWRELGIPGEKEYLGRGVAFCPHCDGPFYKGRRVAVVGGGNSGVEAAIDLAGICSHVTLVEYLDELKADAVLVKNLEAKKNVTIITGARTTGVLGNGDSVTGLRYQERDGDQSHDLELDGVFVQIGLVPNSSFVKDVLETNRFGEIVIDAHCRTNVPGVYAAGDVTTVPFKQIVVAMGEGSKAALTAFEDIIRA